MEGMKPATTEGRSGFVKWKRGDLKGDTGATETRSTPTAASWRLSCVIY